MLALVSGALWAQALPRIQDVFEDGNGSPPGVVASGALVWISGSSFNGLASVRVGSVFAPIYAYSATQILIRIPVGSAGTAPVSAQLIVIAASGTSQPFTLTVISALPTVRQIYAGTPGAPYYFFKTNTCCTPNPFPVPGDIVWMFVNGLGDKLPPDAPKLIIDDQEYPVLGTRTTTMGFGGGPGSGFTCGGAGNGQFCANLVPIISFKIPDLQPGHHVLYLQADGQNSRTVPLDLNYSGIITSQSGLFFGAVQGGPAPLAQAFSILSGSGTINFNLNISTVSGGNWLSVDKTSGSAAAGNVGSPIRVSVNPAGLSAGTYYGTIQVSADRVLNSPQTVTVVLRILPTGTPLGPYLDSSGQIFLWVQGSPSPATQTVTIGNPNATTVTFTSTISTGAQFKYTPASGTIAAGQTAVLRIDANVTGVSVGVYTAQLTLTFSDQSRRIINLLLVVAPAGSTGAKTAGPLSAGGCTPTKLLPVFSQPGAGFNISAGWPTPVAVSIADDCAVPLTVGTVYLTFSNGDAPLSLASLRDGSWSGTWPAIRPVTAGVNITVNANDPTSGLNGTAAVTGGVGANPEVPNLFQGGILDLASGGPALAPGSMIQVYGSKLASAAGLASSLPLPTLLSGATLILGGKPLPLIYASDGQINAMIPYDVPQGTTLQLVAQNGNALSIPQPLLLVPARPAIFTVNQSGQGQGHIYWFDSSSNQILAGPATPAKPGDTVVIYCMGLGTVDPPVQAGVAAPLSSLSRTVNPVTASVGGRTAAVQFAGVTPGTTGLYQVNLTIPFGVPDDNATPLILTANGQSSLPVTLAVRSPR